MKVGIYAIIRCATLIFPAAFLILQPGLIALCLLTIAMGALGALPQTSLKRILAYSTINQLGYIAFGIALLSQPHKPGPSRRRSFTSSATPISKARCCSAQA